MKFSVLQIFCVRLALVFSGLCWSLAVSAQDRPTVNSLDSRLSRVERVLDQSLLEQLQRVDALQQEIRGLRGEIESLSNEVNTLKNRNNVLYDDTDQRLTKIEDSLGTEENFDPEGSFIQGTLIDEDNSTSGEAAGISDSSTDSSSEDAPAIFVREGGPAIPVANPEEFGDGPKPPTNALRETATNAEKLAYNSAYDLLARNQISSAMKSFDDFLNEYPDGPYSDNAWYWQGEAMYAQRQFDLALRNFSVVINSFPESPKVPDARLKVGFSLYEQTSFAEARAILTGVQDDYPGRSASVLARKRLQKMDREGQ